MSSLIRQKRIFWFSLCMWIALFTGFSILVHNQYFEKLDSAVAKFVLLVRTPEWTFIAKSISSSGSTTVYVIVLSCIFLLTYIVFNKRKEAFIFGFGTVSTLVIYKSLKIIIGRERPLELDRLMSVSDFSYPSGHSVLALVIYGYFAYILWHVEELPRKVRQILAVIFPIYIVLMGLSRIYVGVHYTTDVIGGYLLASIILTVCIRLTNRQKPKFY